MGEMNEQQKTRVHWVKKTPVAAPVVHTFKDHQPLMNCLPERENVADMAIRELRLKKCLNVKKTLTK